MKSICPFLRTVRIRRQYRRAGETGPRRYVPAGRESEKAKSYERRRAEAELLAERREMAWRRQVEPGGFAPVWRSALDVMNARGYCAL